MSTLETYEYPVIVHEPDDDKESDTSSVRHLYSPSGQLMARDDDHGKRELSAIIEGSEDGISVGRTTEEHFTETDSEYTERKGLEISEYPGYLAQAHEDHDIVWQNPNSTPYRLNEPSVCNGYIKDVQTDLPYPDSPLSDKEPSSGGYIEDSCYSCVDSARLLESEHVADAGLIGGGEHRDTLTQLESHSGGSPDETLETTPQHTRVMMTEEYALNDPPSDSGISVGLLENGTNVVSLSRFPERAKPALNDGYIPSTISTTSSGYGSEASTSGYKSRFMSISSYATDTSAAPNSGYIPSTFSTASSGYASDSGVSRYKHGSLASELSYETPHMPHFDNGWSNGDGVTDIGLCESPVTHTGKISNVSGYVTESLEPVPRYPLNKHLDLQSKVSVDSSLSTATPDACRDSVFHDDHFTEHLEQSLNAEHECSKGSGVTHNGYIPYPGHEEAAMQDPSNLTDELTLHCDIPNTQHCADAGAADSHSHTSPEITTRRTARTTATSEEEDCVDGSHLHLDSCNDKIASQDYIDSGDNTCFKAPVELFPNELSLKSGYIDPSELQLQSSVHVPEYTPIESVQF